MAAATLSTHVLDTGTGRPADGVLVSVFRGDELVGTGTTDADGRIPELGAHGLAPGSYRIVFDIAPPFRTPTSAAWCIATSSRPTSSSTLRVDPN